MRSLHEECVHHRADLSIKGQNTALCGAVRKWVTGPVHSYCTESVWRDPANWARQLATTGSIMCTECVTLSPLHDLAELDI